MATSTAEKEIAKTLRELCGGTAFINQATAGRAIGMSKEKCSQFLADCPKYPTGKEIKYFIPDIARKMHSIRTFKPYG
jgi:hypothetical protein